MSVGQLIYSALLIYFICAFSKENFKTVNVRIFFERQQAIAFFQLKSVKFRKIPFKQYAVSVSISKSPSLLIILCVSIYIIIAMNANGLGVGVVAEFWNTNLSTYSKFELKQNRWKPHCTGNYTHPVL